MDRRGTNLLRAAERVTIKTADGTRLRSIVNRPHLRGPLVIVIHGWLGDCYSPYMLRVTAMLVEAGFNVARLLLRDHGSTAALNLELFNSARIDEVVNAAEWLVDAFGHGGIMGFSLGGNFALRVASRSRGVGISACLAICPVIDPASAAKAIDGGWIGYRWYFLRKWKQALTKKQIAFPHRYDFDDAMSLASIATLTDYFVERYTPYRDTPDYYSQYTVSEKLLKQIEMPVEIVSAADDPIVPVNSLMRFGDSHGVPITITDHGGHCAFIQDLELTSAVGPHAVQFFSKYLSQTGF